MVEINLLPKEYQKKTQPNVWKYASWAAVGLTAAVLGGWFIAVSGNTNRLRAQSEDLQKQIEAVAPQKQRYNELTARKTELEQVTNVALQLRDRKTYWSNDLAAFVGRMPGNVVLNSINMATVDSGAAANPAYAGKAVTRQLDLAGRAGSQEAIISFLNAYETDANFGVDFKSMQRDATTGAYTFSAAVGVVGDQAANAAASATTPVPASGTAPAPAPSAPATPAPAGGNP